jgi:hypothetical protein
LLGLPILGFSVAQRFLPARFADAINAPIVRLAIGSLEPLGFKVAAEGPLRTSEEDGCVPVLDIGALAKIRAGDIATRETKLNRHSAEVVNASACSSPPMRPFSAA